MHHISPPYKNKKSHTWMTWQILEIELSDTNQNEFINVWLRFMLWSTNRRLKRSKFRETLCSWVCAFVFYSNFLHQLVMLGPKKHSPKEVGQQSAKDHGVNYWGAELQQDTLPILAPIMLKFRIVSNKQIYILSKLFNFSQGSGWIVFQNMQLFVES